MASQAPSTSGTQATVPSEDSTSYGVELEFVFAFHEEELKQELAVGEEIRKKLGYNIRERNGQRFIPNFTIIPPTQLPNHTYRSWGIWKDGRYEATDGVGPYEQQPQRILRKHLNAKCPGIHFQLYGTLQPDEKTNDKYKDWSIVAHHSVCGVGSENIPSRLPDRVVEDSANNWDSYGLKIVAPFLSKKLGEKDIQIFAVTDAIKGTPSDTYGAVITNQCGLHVHVPAPSDGNVLRQLAIIILVYEEQISRLHPPCRWPSHRAAKGNIESNRLGLMRDPYGWGSPSEERQGAWNVDCSTSALRASYTIEQIQNYVHERASGSGTVEQNLAEAMNWPKGEEGCARVYRHGNRNRVVNFTSACRGEGFPKTIEFRQARGSLCPKEIGYWVDFCVGLLRIASLYAQGIKEFRIKTWDDVEEADGSYDRQQINVFELMTDMGLGDDTIKYFQKMMAKYQARYEEDERSDNEEPPPEAEHSSRGSGRSSLGSSSPSGDDGSGSGPPGGGPTDKRPLPEDDKDGDGGFGGLSRDTEPKRQKIEHDRNPALDTDDSEALAFDGPRNNDMNLIPQIELATKSAPNSDEDTEIIDGDFPSPGGGSKETDHPGAGSQGLGVEEYFPESGTNIVAPDVEISGAGDSQRGPALPTAPCNGDSKIPENPGGSNNQDDGDTGSHGEVAPSQLGSFDSELSSHEDNETISNENDEKSSSGEGEDEQPSAFGAAKRLSQQAAMQEAVEHDKEHDILDKDAEKALDEGNWQKAVDLYRSLLNSKFDDIRAQANLRLAGNQLQSVLDSQQTRDHLNAAVNGLNGLIKRAPDEEKWRELRYTHVPSHLRNLNRRLRPPTDQQNFGGLMDEKREEEDEQINGWLETFSSKIPISEFDPTKWKALETPYFFGDRVDAQAAHAIYDSVVLQHPGKDHARINDVGSLLKILDKRNKNRRRGFHTVSEVEQALSDSTDSQYSLVLVEHLKGPDAKATRLIQNLGQSDLYLLYERVGNTMVWKSMKKRLPDDEESNCSGIEEQQEQLEQLEREQQVGEDTTEQGVIIEGFNASQWETEPSERSFFGCHNGQAADAIYSSLKLQYPASSHANDLNLEDIVKHIQQAAGSPHAEAHTIDQVVNILSHFTDETYNLVVVENWGTPTVRATRMSQVSETDLLVLYRKVGEFIFWHAMTPFKGSCNPEENEFFDFNRVLNVEKIVAEVFQTGATIYGPLSRKVPKDYSTQIKDSNLQRDWMIDADSEPLGHNIIFQAANALAHSFHNQFPQSEQANMGVGLCELIYRIRLVEIAGNTRVILDMREELAKILGNDSPGFNLVVIETKPKEENEPPDNVGIATRFDWNQPQDLFVLFRIDGKPLLWQGLKRRSAEKVDGGENPTELEQPSVEDDFPQGGAIIPNFNMDEWQVSLFTNWALGDRRQVTACHAVIESLKIHYPDSPYAERLPIDALNHLDAVTTRNGHRNHFHEPEDVAEALRELTNGEFHLVMVTKKVDKRVTTYKATRVSPGRPGHGQELFIYCRQIISPRRGKETYWKTLLKKKKKKEKNSNPSPTDDQADVHDNGNQQDQVTHARSNAPSLSPTDHLGVVVSQVQVIENATSLLTLPGDTATSQAGSNQQDANQTDPAVPYDGQEYPPGRDGLDPNEYMVYRAPFYQPRDFNMRDWRVHRTSSAIGNRQDACAANAIYNSLRLQYPADAEHVGEGTSAANVLQHMDVLEAAQTSMHDETQVDRGLSSYTFGRYRLVVVHGDRNNAMATRVGPTAGLFGMNLYIRHTPRVDSRSGQMTGHWEAMEKRRR